jgi:hypothetical protein
MSMRFWLEVQEVLFKQEGDSQAQSKRCSIRWRFRSIFQAFRKKSSL